MILPISIQKKSECTGCGACSNKCPQKCIIFKEDSCGFSYPKVNTLKCMDCGLCEKVCPLKNNMKSNNRIKAVYAGWSKEPELRISSTSGGVFSVLAYHVLEMGGLVSGAIYDSENTICHTIVSQKKDIVRLWQSKYAQSRINSVYTEIKKALKMQPVLFCGAPCQVAGLISFLGGHPKGLYIVDFICRGVNSPKAYREWLKELEEQQRAKATRVWFKYKEDGWKQSPRCTRIDFADGSKIVQKGMDNTFMCGYLGNNLYIRPSCGSCCFKGQERYGDLTVGDFWGVDPKYDDDKGTSLILINSEQGMDLFEQVKPNLFTVEREIGEISSGNVCFTDSVRINPKSEEFLKVIGKDMPFSEAIRKYTAVSFFTKIKRCLKRMMKLNKK